MSRESALRPASSRLAARRRVWIFRTVAAALLALTFGYLPYRIYARSGFAHYLRLRNDLAAIHAQNAKLRGENDRLSREVDALSSDPRALERVVRAELGWVRPGEVILDLEPERRTPPPRTP
jgi:cell division protein FtsB